MSLQLEHMDDIPRRQGAPDNFTGTTYFQPVAANEACRLLIGRVTFEKGARTFWHTHTGEQVLYFLKGRGRVQMRGSSALDAVEGDVVHIPASTEHWHGAHPEEERTMQHMAITFGEPTWLEPVSEEEYSAG
ncbi:MAG: cupin domain-containing protein [Chloroflexota bacterium]|nr:cupin domain-containing protein [Chloroflexota bacterium]